jgi:hypothetical protein
VNIERVHWVDSGTHLSDGWQNLAIVREAAETALVEVTTCGYNVHEDDEVIVLGLSIDPVNDNVYGAQVIAKSNVTFRETLLTDPIAA